MIEYLFKSSVCLATFYLLYHFALRDKKLFNFNRFYLLATLILGLTIPLFQIPVQSSYIIQDHSISVFSLNVSEHPPLIDSGRPGSAGNSISQFQLVFFIIYLGGTIIMLLRFLHNLWSISVLRRNGKEIEVDGHTIILSKGINRSFSFLSRIYLSVDDFHSNTGSDVINHECAHLQNAHSYDLIFIEVLLIVFWFQPLFYFFKNAIILNHEFIADEYAIVRSSDKMAYFNQVIAESAAPQFRLTNNLSFISIKNRIKMTNKNVPSKSMMSLIIGGVLMVSIGLFSVFAFKQKAEPGPLSTSKYVVILDAGHGGNDDGASSKSGLLEKDITLDLTNKIASKLADDDQIKVILTRDRDVNIQLKDRTLLSGQANLFLSIHVETDAENTNSKFKHILYSDGESSSKLSASVINHVFQEKYDEKTRVESASYYVLKNASCTAVLLNVGFLSNSEDEKILGSEAGREKVADQIIESLRKLAVFHSN